MGNCKSEPLNLQNAGTTFFTQCNTKPLPKAEDIFISIVKIQSITRGFLTRRKYQQQLSTNRDIKLIRNLQDYARQVLLSRHLTYDPFDYSASKTPFEKPVKTTIKSIESSDLRIKYYGEWFFLFYFFFFAILFVF